MTGIGPSSNPPSLGMPPNGFAQTNYIWAAIRKPPRPGFVHRSQPHPREAPDQAWGARTRRHPHPIQSGHRGRRRWCACPRLGDPRGARRPLASGVTTTKSMTATLAESSSTRGGFTGRAPWARSWVPGCLGCTRPGGGDARTAAPARSGCRTMRNSPGTRSGTPSGISAARCSARRLHWLTAVTTNPPPTTPGACFVSFQYPDTSSPASPTGRRPTLGKTSS